MGLDGTSLISGACLAIEALSDKCAVHLAAMSWWLCVVGLSHEQE